MNRRRACKLTIVGPKHEDNAISSRILVDGVEFMRELGYSQEFVHSSGSGDGKQENGGVFRLMELAEQVEKVARQRACEVAGMPDRLGWGCCEARGMG